MSLILLTCAIFFRFSCRCSYPRHRCFPSPPKIIHVAVPQAAPQDIPASIATAGCQCAASPFRSEQEGNGCRPGRARRRRRGRSGESNCMCVPRLEEFYDRLQHPGCADRNVYSNRIDSADHPGRLPSSERSQAGSDPVSSSPLSFSRRTVLVHHFPPLQETCS